ncbi:MAG TPA: 50S ribosomal protein L13 [Candidatus Bathyarchaeia archaeon]|nr:50S ribosomal protein L13 [Candidatus Bathyarchaeia archaeon]
MNKKTPTKEKYFLFNCENFILGRMAAEIAFLLQGKDKPQYAPNKVGECKIIVTNCDKMNVTGRKMHDKMYHSFSGYPGGITSRKLEEVLEKDSRKVVWAAVYGMLPKNKLRNVMMKKMFIFKDDKHGIQNVEVEEVKPKSA